MSLEASRGYLQFIRKQRSQTLHDLDLNFQETLNRRLRETTYDSRDVRDILQELQITVRSTVEDELILQSHMNVLLLQQLFQQAASQQKAYSDRVQGTRVQLQVSLAQLEDRFALDIYLKLGSCWTRLKSLRKSSLPRYSTL